MTINKESKCGYENNYLCFEIIIIVSLVTAFGFWALSEWNKRYPEPVKVEKTVKIYQGRWHKTYLEVIK